MNWDKQRLQKIILTILRAEAQSKSPVLSLLQPFSDRPSMNKFLLILTIFIGLLTATEVKHHRGPSYSLPVKGAQSVTVPALQGRVSLRASYFLFKLETVNSWCELAKNLVCLLVVFELGGDELSEVAERFGCVEDLLIVSVCWPKMESDGVSRTLAHVHSS